MSEFVPGESIVLRINMAFLGSFPLVCEIVRSLWFPENQRVVEERAVEQIIMYGWRFLNKICFEK